MLDGTTGSEHILKVAKTRRRPVAIRERACRKPIAVRLQIFRFEQYLRVVHIGNIVDALIVWPNNRRIKQGQVRLARVVQQN